MILEDGSIIVDENTERELKELEAKATYEIEHGVGLWGRRALDYIYSDDAPSFIMQFDLEARGNKGMNKYARMIDRLADKMQDEIEEALLKTPEYALDPEDYLHNVRTYNAVKAIAEEEIWAQLIRVDSLIEDELYDRIDEEEYVIEVDD